MAQGQPGSPPIDQPAWLDQPVPPAPSAAPSPEPVLEQQAPMPAWNRPAPRIESAWIYITGVALIVAIGISVLFVRGQLAANTDSAASVQVATPSPTLSDYERADRFLNVDLGPPLAEVVDASPAVQTRCTSKLPPACKDALIVLNKAMLDVDEAIAKNQRDIPVCIGRAMQQFQYDWRGMEQGVSQAIGGYAAGSRALIIQGLYKFASIAQYLKPDITRINKAVAACPKTV
jgi:hypothetical protein